MKNFSNEVKRHVIVFNNQSILLQLLVLNQPNGIVLQHVLRHYLFRRRPPDSENAGISAARIVQIEKLIFEFFSNPNRAIKEFFDERQIGEPCTLITDYRMHEKDGAKVIRDMKHFNTSIKSFILSGEANTSQVDDLVNDDLLAAFIIKPWGEEELAAAVMQVLDK